MANSYSKIRDLSWQTLLENGIDSLPVRVSAICKNLGIRLYTFEQSQDLILGYGLWALTQNNDGFLVRAGQQYSIFYNGQQPTARSRFTVAHELGHFLLRHRAQQHEGLSLSGREKKPANADRRLETEANMFASRLLAPACVLQALGATSAEQIAELCGISAAAARFRAARLESLQGRDRFLSCTLERRVYDQFLPFIDRCRARAKDCPSSS